MALFRIVLIINRPDAEKTQMNTMEYMFETCGQYHLDSKMLKGLATFSILP